MPAFVLILWIATLRDGHIWGDDFAHYIMQAENLAKLENYAPRNYVVNPATSYLGPQVVPPGVSVILAPVIRVFGSDFRAMKIWLAVWFAAGLVILYLISMEFLPPGWSLLVVAFFALNPVLFESRDSITPEKPYYLISFALLWFLLRAYRRAPDVAPDLRIAPIIGLLLYFSYATRNLGIALFPVVGAYDLLKMRRISRFGLLSLAIGGGLGVVHTLLLGTGDGYGRYFNWSAHWIGHSAIEYVASARVFFRYPQSKVLTIVGCLAVGLTTITGALVTRFIEPVKLYLLAYGVIISAYFSPGYVYYLYPLLALVGLYAMCGLQRLSELGRIGKLLTAGFILIVAGAYGSSYAAADMGPIREGIGDPEFVRMAAFVRTTAGPNDTVMFLKPRLLSMLTQRKSTAPSLPLGQEPRPDLIWSDAQKLGVTFLLAADVPDFLARVPVNLTLDRMIQQHQADLELQYQTGPYRLYRIRRRSSPPLPAANVQQPQRIK